MGLLAASDDFCALASALGGQRDRVGLHLMFADEAAGHWQPVVTCHVAWLPRLKAVVDRAVSELLITPDDPMARSP